MSPERISIDIDIEKSGDDRLASKTHSNTQPPSDRPSKPQLTSSSSSTSSTTIISVPLPTTASNHNQELTLSSEKIPISSTTDEDTDDQDEENNEKFEVGWDGPDDPGNPLNWRFLKKAGILLVVSLQTLMVVLYSTSFLSGGPGLAKDFEIDSKLKLASGMTTYMLGLASGPLILAPMSELYGRRPVYIISMFLFFILILPACLAQNYATILAVRFFSAFVGSVTISNAPGTLGDIFTEEYRTFAFSCFCVAPMNGPLLGPLIGGFVYENLGWRWTNWIVFIGAGVLWIIALLVPETYGPLLLKRRAERLRKETGDERYRSRFCPSADSPPIRTGSKEFWRIIGRNMARPIIMGITEPICIFWEVYIAVIYANLYLCFVGYPIIFVERRGFSQGIAGLAFVGIGVGTVIALCLDPVTKKIYNMHKIDPDTGKRPPEARIFMLCIASILSPISLFWFAWTSVPTSIHWIWPILAGVPYGVGNTFIFLHGNTYLVECYDRYAASALAGNSVARSILGGILPLFGGKMYYNLGPNWAGTLVACLALLLMPIPWAFYRWGKKIRVRSPILKRLQEEKRVDEEKMRRRAERAKGEAGVKMKDGEGLVVQKEVVA